MRVIEGNKAATSGHEEQTCIHAEHMPKHTNTCIETIETHTNTNAVPCLSASLQRSEQQNRLATRDPPHEGVCG